MFRNLSAVCPSDVVILFITRYLPGLAVRLQVAVVVVLDSLLTVIPSPSHVEVEIVLVSNQAAQLITRVNTAFSDWLIVASLCSAFSIIGF